MTLEQAKAIVDKMDDQRYVGSVYEDYSGRGMYGKTTPGVRGESEGEIAWAMGALGIEPDYRIDSLGLGVIVY